MKRHRVLESEKLKDGKGMFLRIDGDDIALFRIDGEFFAIGNVCPHQHFSLLYQGELNGYVVTCPMHGWSYDIRTGQSTNASGRVKKYEVEVNNDGVFIRQDGDPHGTD